MLEINKGKQVIKFRYLTQVEFEDRYLENFSNTGDDGDLDEGEEYGEIEIPVHGWKGCIIKDGAPSMWLDDDDGWSDVPEGDYFELAPRPIARR
jgi:hypothetical protein